MLEVPSRLSVKGKPTCLNFCTALSIFAANYLELVYEVCCSSTRLAHFRGHWAVRKVPNMYPAHLSSDFYLFYSFCLLPYFPPNRPFAGIFSLFFVVLLFLSLKQQLPSSCCFARATAVILFVLFGPCNRCLFLFCTYGVPLAIAAFPFLSDLLASHSSEHLSLVSICFLHSFLFFPFSHFCFFRGLACFVAFSYPVR